MKLIEYNDEFKTKLVEFNINNYPNRTQIKERVDYYLNYNCKGFKTKILLGVDQEKIIGQIFLLPCFIKNDEDVYYWGMDYFVQNDYRNTPIGVMLLRKALKKHNHLGMAFSPISLKIHKVLGEQQVGDLKLFIKPNFNIVFSVFKRNKFPDNVNCKKETFYLTETLTYQESEDFKNGSSIYRNEDFLNWRFKTFDKKTYYKYQSINKNIYVVVRPVLLKKIKMLLVVDYRLPNCDSQNFDILNDLINKILKNTNCYGVLFYNSLPKFDAYLKKAFYFKFKNLPILSNKPLTNLFVTPADSDFDLNI